MKRFAAVFTFALVALALGACCHMGQRHEKMGGRAAVGSAIYWCQCGAECKCNTVSVNPGKCRCDKEMAGGHVVRIEGNTALVCPCGPTCNCAIDPKDPTKCGCGKTLQRVNLEGTGIYFCNCKGSCGCNTLSDQPGTCKCGMPLHQAK